MNGRNLTIGFILVVVVIGVIYDLLVWHLYGSAATISWVTWTSAKKWPIIPFAMGILCGHLFWVQQTGMLMPKKMKEG